MSRALTPDALGRTPLGRPFFQNGSTVNGPIVAKAHAEHDADLTRRSGLAWIVAAAMLSVLVRLPRLHRAVHYDEAEYAYVARWWARGARLYTDVFVDRPQLLLVLYRALGAFGDFAVVPLRVFVMLWGAALVATVAWIVREVGGSWRSAAISAFLIAWLSASPIFEGDFANGELLAALPASLCIALAARAARLDRCRLLLAAGVLGACAVLIKQSGIDGTAAVGLWLLVRRGPGVARRVQQSAALAAGFIGIIGLAAVHGATLGFDRWAFAMVGSRVGQNRLNGSDLLVERLAASLLAYVPGVAGPIVCLVVALVVGRRRPIALARIWLVMSGAAFLAGGSFWPHYYLALLPPVCATIGLAFDAVGPLRRRPLAVGLAAFTAVPLLTLGPSLFDLDMPTGYRDAVASGEYIRAHVPMNEPIVNFAGNLAAALADRPVEVLNFRTIYDKVIPKDVPIVVDALDRPGAAEWVLARGMNTLSPDADAITAVLSYRYVVAYRSGEYQVFRRQPEGPA